MIEVKKLEDDSIHNCCNSCNKINNHPDKLNLYKLAFKGECSIGGTFIVLCNDCLSILNNKSQIELLKEVLV